MDDSVINGFQTLRSRISGDCPVSAAVANGPHNNEEAPGICSAHGRPAFLALGRDTILQIDDWTRKGLFGFFWKHAVPGQMGDIMVIPVKTQGAVHALILYAQSTRDPRTARAQKRTACPYLSVAGIGTLLQAGFV